MDTLSEAGGGDGPSKDFWFSNAVRFLKSDLVTRGVATRDDYEGLCELRRAVVVPGINFSMSEEECEIFERFTRVFRLAVEQSFSELGI